jgi:hypothetical protein
VISLPRTAPADHTRHPWGIDATKTMAMLWISGLVLAAAVAIGSLSAVDAQRQADIAGQAVPASAPGFISGSPQPGPAPRPALR